MAPAKKRNSVGPPGRVAALLAGHERAALSQEEPYENAGKATEATPGWCYRILTMHEKPGQLREVQNKWNRDSLRNMVIRGVARGNDSAARRQFLHATTNLKKAKDMFFERRRRYQPPLVRWRLDAIPPHLRLDLVAGTKHVRGSCSDKL